MQSRPSPFSRAIASLGVLLVLVLTVLASSPELHERIHGHAVAATAGTHSQGDSPGQPNAPDGDDGCVVTLFAQGVVLCLSLLALAFTGQTVRLPAFALLERIAPEAPGYLHLPPQAPPLG